MWFVIGLVWIVVMIGIIYTYNRKQRRRSSERAQQMEKMLVELKANPRAAVALEPGPVPAPGAVVPQFSRKPRLLPPATAALYYVFRTGLPDHEIFAGVALDDVLEVAAQTNAARREQLMHRLGQPRLDLVICTKQLEIVAAVVVGTGDDRAKFASECLESAGIRVVRIDPAAPPRHHQVSALVYG